jgi:hypothetical protein
MGPLVMPTTIVIAERITQGLQAHHQGFWPAPSCSCCERSARAAPVGPALGCRDKGRVRGSRPRQG